MDVITDRAYLLSVSGWPGLDPHEWRVLRQFIRSHGAEFDEFRFGVRVGQGVQLPADNDPALRRAIEANSKARPDCVAFRRPNVATIIEAKDGWHNEAVWQLKGYGDLYRETFPGDSVALVGVARLATPTSRTLSRTQGITLYLYDLPPFGTDVREVAPEDVTNGV